jgi:hypothetical protein
MISQHSARVVGVTLGLCVGVACRDAPTDPRPTVAGLQPSASLTLESPGRIDSVDQLPPEPRILNPYTHIGYAEQGGRYLLELRVGMEYIGNKASMTTDYSITGDGVSQHDKIYNEHDGFYTANLSGWKRFEQVYYIEVPRSCGLEFDAYTHHQAWWWLYLRLMPDWKSTRATAGSKGVPYQLQPCEEEEEESEEVEGEIERRSTTTTSGGGGDGGSGGGGSITIETCWYWATIENGVVVNVELDYCTISTISFGPMEM